MEKMSSGHVEYIGILLVREYLTAKRLVSTLRCMELEHPLKIRHSNMRLVLSKMFNIEDASACAETLNSYQSMLEIIMREFIKNKANHADVEYSLQQYEADEPYSPKCVTPELHQIVHSQLSNSRCESATIKSSTSVTEFENIFGTRTSSIQIERETTIKLKKRYDFQNVKKILNFVAIQGKSKYMNRDEECLSNEEKPLQGYGADQPKDYPKQHSQSCLRDREEILMSSLRRSPDYLNDDNSVRLGPNKVNIFQCLKTNVELPSSAEETGKKCERFYRIIPKITKKLSDSSLVATKTVQDNDREDVPLESTKQPSAEDKQSSTSPYSEEQPSTCDDSPKEHSHPEIIISDIKNVPISKNCTNTSNKEDSVVSDDERNTNAYVVDNDTQPVQSENIESTNINQSFPNGSDIIRIPVDDILNPSKETRRIEEPLENSVDSLKVENEIEDRENNAEKKSADKISISNDDDDDDDYDYDDKDVVYEQIETVRFEPINTKLSKKLTKLFTGNESSLDVPSRWRGQSFVFNDSTKLKYGLMQAQGGPCGVIAVVQAFLLKALLFDDRTQAVCQDPFRPTQVELKTGLVHAVSEILWQAGKGESAVLALYKSASDDDNDDGDEEEEEEKTIICRKFNKLLELQSAIKQELNQFLSTDGNGCYLVAISAILSSGIESVLSDMDEASNSLIVNGGSCSLELVNLLLTGNAVSNVFDNNMHIGPCLLKGVSKRSNIGFLSIYEHSNACQVGSNLKTPRYPIWVVNCQNHFTVIYSENKKLISDWRAERQFNVYLYDSMSNQKEEVKLTIDTTGLYLRPRREGEYVPPIELCLLTKWKGAAISWNGNKYK